MVESIFESIVLFEKIRHPNQPNQQKYEFGKVRLHDKMNVMYFKLAVKNSSTL